MSSPRKLYMAQSPRPTSSLKNPLAKSPQKGPVLAGRPQPNSPLKLASTSSSNSNSATPAVTTSSTGGMDSIKVAVRVRPNTATSLVTRRANQVSISSADGSREPKTFAFDQCFQTESNTDIYSGFAREFLDHTFEGYNACILAYGQTSSGKSHTIMGCKQDEGLISLACRDIFQRAQALCNHESSVTVRVSFCEIYNEQIIDLLDDSMSNQNKKLRIKDSATGPYVEGLSDLIVKNFDQAIAHLNEGTARRATAATKMNNVSSRSHAVFSIQIKQVKYDDMGTQEVISRIRLVDLAGSERANLTGATGDRLKEGANINKSLVALGRVISILASSDKRQVVPYRDSVLTRLLQDSLGGNSKTAMMACIAPDSYEQSLSTLRYADQAKRIKTSATINHETISTADADAKIQQMQKELTALQQQLATQEEGHKITNAMRFLEEQATALEARCKWFEGQYKAARTHNELMSGYLREIQNGQVKKQAKKDDLKRAINETELSLDSLRSKAQKWDKICQEL